MIYNMSPISIITLLHVAPVSIWNGDSSSNSFLSMHARTYALRMAIDSYYREESDVGIISSGGLFPRRFLFGDVFILFVRGWSCEHREGLVRGWEGL